MLFVLVMFISWSIFFAPQKVTSVPVNIVPEKPVVTVEVKNPVPQLKSPTASASAITAQSYYAIDVKTGTQLLAKREEEIYLPNEAIPIKLPKFSPALQLLQKIRDEAHRFAIAYYRKLHSKSLIQK